MTGRGLCRLLFVLVALCMSATASAGRGGGGWYHGGGGGWGGGYGGVNHSGSWSGGGSWSGSRGSGSWSGGGSWNGSYHGGGWYHGSYYHGGGYYHGGYYHGWYGCCGSVSVGFYFGPGFVYGYPYYPYYYPPYYSGVYYPYVSGDFSQPTEYVEQGQVQDQAGGGDMNDQSDQGGGAPQLAFWYFCEKPQGYYPYVRACPGGWQKVPARPPDS